MLNGLLNLQWPEATTIIRWLLRAALVVFLAWLGRRKPEEEEEEEPAPAEQYDSRRPGAKHRAPGRGATRLPQRRLDPYPTTVRNRRQGVVGEGVDFDAVVGKMSKSKEMWEVRKAGEGPPQILHRREAQEQDHGAGRPAPPGLAGGGGNPSGAGAASIGAATGAAAGGAGTSGAAPQDRAKIAAAKDARGKELHGHERPVTFIAWNKDCNLLFTCGKDKLVCVWGVPEGDLLGTYEGHNGAVWACSVTADSKWLVTSGADQLVIVWEARESKELARVELLGVVRCVEWAGAAGGSAGGGAGGAPAAERFVTCHYRFGAHPPAVAIWRFDGTTIEELQRITSLPTASSQVRWGRGDHLVASAHENGELVFWSADTGAEMKRLKAHDAPISKFDFSADRELVATVSSDKSVRIWDLGEGEPRGAEWRSIYHVQTDRPLNAVAMGPLSRSAAVGPPGQRPKGCCVIAAGGQDVRDVTTSGSTTEQFGTLLLKLGLEESLPCELQAEGVTKGHFGPVHTLAFAKDGSAIASGSEDGCVRLHLFDQAAGAAGAVPVAGLTPVAPAATPAAGG